MSIVGDMMDIMLNALQDMPHAERNFAVGQYLFHRGDRVQSIFAVKSGAVHLIRHTQGGNAVILQRAGPGAVLAEASMFATVYHCDAVATSAVATSVFRKAVMQQRFFTDKDFARTWASHLAKEIRNARLRSEILALRTVAERLDAWLAERGPLPEKGVWKAIAEDIGTSPEALYREIAKRRISPRTAAES